MIGYSTRTLLVSSNDSDRIAKLAQVSEEAKVGGVYDHYMEQYDYENYYRFKAQNTCGDGSGRNLYDSYHRQNDYNNRCKATDMNDDKENPYFLSTATTYPSFFESDIRKLTSRKVPDTIHEDKFKDFATDDDFVSICNNCKQKKLDQELRSNLKTYKDTFVNTVYNFNEAYTETINPSTSGMMYNKKPAMTMVSKNVPERDHPTAKPVLTNAVTQTSNINNKPLSNEPGYVKNLITQELEKDNQEIPIFRDVNSSKRPANTKPVIIPLLEKGTDNPLLGQNIDDLYNNPKTKYMLLLKNIDGTIEEAIEISKAARKVLYNEGISDVVVDRFVETKTLKTIKKSAEEGAKKKPKATLAEKIYNHVNSRYHKNCKPDETSINVNRRSPVSARRGNTTVCNKQCYDEFSRPPRRVICSAREIDPGLRYRLSQAEE